VLRSQFASYDRRMKGGWFFEHQPPFLFLKVFACSNGIDVWSSCPNTSAPTCGG
jgi:hypothetical protein